MCGPGEPRAQVQMAVHKLAKRAQNNHGWLVRHVPSPCHVLPSHWSLPAAATACRSHPPGRALCRWQVTLKCLMSFHRLMRETDAAFMQEVRLIPLPPAHPPIPHALC